MQTRAKFPRNYTTDTESRLREMRETHKQIRRFTHRHDKAVTGRKKHELRSMTRGDFLPQTGLIKRNVRDL